MTPTERRASFSLATVFALRMLGLFLVLPVFMLEARQYPGGDDIGLVGLAMGAYGLTQALMQMPLGLASDRWGRKRIIYLGLTVFAAGSLVAALAESVQGLIVGRALQGAGAVGAAVTALLADLTRDSVRTKGMALIGVSIGLMFALSLVLAPPLAAVAGLPGIFGLTFVLTLLGALAVWRWTPPEPDRSLHPQASGGLVAVLKHPQLWRLNIGVFTLHAVQLAMWMAVPAMLTQAGLAPAAHWQVYLPTVLGGFVLTGGIFALERRGHMRSVLRGAVALLLLVQCGLFWSASSDARIAPLVVWLFLFFLVFNVLEASQPSLVSRLAPASARGAAMGLYNTLQSVGFFVGGALGGVAVKYAGSQGLFILCAGMALVWLVVGWGIQLPAPPPQTHSANPPAPATH
ncbi:MAG TPA: MFS transporter [Burkholderiaceae bacterium]|nr:MFS transporter [Burkholderiaceae bacterium]